MRPRGSHCLSVTLELARDIFRSARVAHTLYLLHRNVYICLLKIKNSDIEIFSEENAIYSSWHVDTTTTNKENMTKHVVIRFEIQ